MTATAPVASWAHRTMDSTTASTSCASSSAAAIVCIASLRLASARNRRRDASSASSRRLAKLIASCTSPASASAARSRPSGPTRSVFPGTTTPTSHRRPPTDTSRVTASGATAGSPYRVWPPSNTTSWVSARELMLHQGDELVGAIGRRHVADLGGRSVLDRCERDAVPVQGCDDQEPGLAGGGKLQRGGQLGTPAARAALVTGPRAGSLPTSSPRTDRLSRFDGVTAITG